MKFIARAYPWLLAAPVVLPVVIWGGVVYPYLVPKTLLFYALALLTAGAFFVLVAHGTPFRWNRLRSKPAWVPGLLLVLAYVASVFGIDAYRSFWSLFVRGDGLLMLTGVTGYFYLILLSADRAWCDRFLRAVALVGSAVALYGIGEWLFSGGRVGSLLGNAAFFAGYLGIAVYATLLAARGLPRAYRRAAQIGAALQVIAIVLSATRGTILALLLAALAYAAYLAYAGAGKRRGAAMLTLGVTLVAAGLFVGFRSELAKVPFSPVARLATIGTHDPDVASRLFIWKHMLTQIEQHPLLGVGAEHIDVLFNRFYDPTQIQEEWFDRSHNAYLDYAAQYGVLGFVLYLALIGAFWFAAARFARRGARAEAILVSLLALTYAAQNFFIFDTISSFWLLLALLALFLTQALPEAAPEPLAFPRWTRLASWGAAVVLALLIIPYVIRPAIAAYDVAHGYALALIAPAASAEYLRNGFALGTYGNLEYGYEAYDMYTKQSARLSGAALDTAYTTAQQILKADFERFPYDARTALYYAHVLALAPQDVGVDRGELSTALARAIAESPKRAQPWYLLVNLAIDDANAHPAGSPERAAGYAAAEDLLSRYIAQVPTLSEPYFVLAQLEFASGNKEAAAAAAAKGKRYYVPDLPTASRAVEYYETALDLPDAAFFLREVLSLDPANASAQHDLTQIEGYGTKP